MSAINDALQKVGVNLATDAATNLIGAIGDFNKQNLSPGGQAVANAGLRILSQATGIGALSPGAVVRGVAGTFESVHYADDLNNHHPKFKFLFKVQFDGFPGGSFSYYVHRCDKPKVVFNHSEVNYYNFRTKVLTSTTFTPLTFTFLDEIGNTVNSFFAMYVSQRSNQGNGKASIQGGAEYSSTIPYDNGYSAGKTVKIQQIFGNGLATNIFTLVNARIDSLDFDELSMELSAGSMMTCTVSYDAITCETTGPNKVNSWGQTDLYSGGGSSGAENAGSSSTTIPAAASGTGGGIGGQSSFLTPQLQSAFGTALTGLASIAKIPAALADLVKPLAITALGKFNQSGIVGSIGDVLSSNIQGTIAAVSSGANLRFGSNDGAYTGDVKWMNDIMIDGSSINSRASDAAAAANNPNYSNEGRAATAATNNPNYSNEGRGNPGAVTAASNNPNYSNEGRGAAPIDTGNGPNPNITDASRAAAAVWVTGMNP